MRPFGMVVTALLAGAWLAHGQQPPQGQTPAAQNPQTKAPVVPAQPTNPPVAQPASKLDLYLQRWELEMQKVQSLRAQVILTEKDETFQATRKYDGFAQYMKDGIGPTALSLAALELKAEGTKTGEFDKKYICTGTYLYDFAKHEKEIRAYEMARPKPGQVGEDSFLTFLFGMKAEEAKRRYDLKLNPAKPEDQWYIYVNVLPVSPEDKADFQYAQIVLNKDSFLPRRLWFKRTNRDEIMWDIPRIEPNVRLNRADFDAPRTPPPGWKVVAIPRNTNPPPKVIRGGNP